MKKSFLTACALLSMTSLAFTTESFQDTKLALFGMSNQKSAPKSYKEKSKPQNFFIAYRFLFSDQKDDNLDVFATQNALNTPPINDNVHVNWDWEIGHEGWIGVNFTNTFFSLFANGQYLEHKRKVTAQITSGSITPIGPLVGTMATAPATAVARGKSRFWRAGIFVAYLSYKQSTFFIMPYIGPQYYNYRLTLNATITGQQLTESPTYEKKCNGFGPLIGTTAKYYFNQFFYAYGDLRLSTPMIRFTEQGIQYFDQNGNGIADPFFVSEKESRFDAVLHEAVGIGFEANGKHFGFDFMLSYEIVNFFNCSVTYHTLGATVGFGF